MKKLFVIFALICLVSANSAEAKTVLKKTQIAPKNVLEDEEEEYSDSDPIEPINRAIFKFNQVVDGVALKPVSQIYRGVVPQWGRDRVSNILYNITEPVTVVNSVFQGDPENAFTSVWRFIINTTFGVLGTFDAAGDLGLKARKEDFGQTLAVWGLGEGPYIVLPIIGPSSTRDTVGLGVDYATNPINWGRYTDPNERIALYVAKAIDSRTSILDVTDEIERTSLDPYASYRSLYLQKRRGEVRNGK
jgi:phospholipid-binding lipoprotein MlaA